MTGPSLFHGPPQLFAGQVGRDRALMAVSDRVTGEVDDALIHAAIGEGYRVFIQPRHLALVLSRRPDLTAAEEMLVLPTGEIAEIVARAAEPRQTAAAIE